MTMVGMYLILADRRWQDGCRGLSLCSPLKMFPRTRRRSDRGNAQKTTDRVRGNGLTLSNGIKTESILP